MSTNYLTLTRQSLYDLVWSKPMTEVAKGFGISDVALAKRCRAVDIPVPPRGYWARIAGGQTPHQPKLPKLKRHDAHQQEGTVRVPKRAPRMVVPTPPVVVRPIATSPAGLNNLLPAITRAARVLRHPDRGQLSFGRGTARGPIPNIHVSAGLLDRALHFADSLLRACEGLGWSFDGAGKDEEDASRQEKSTGPRQRKRPEYGSIRIGTVRISFEISERIELRTLPPTDRDMRRQARSSWYRAPIRTETIHKGELRLARPGFGYSYHVQKKTWRDRGTRLIESKLPAILTDFAQSAATVAAKNEELERERLAREEAAREREAAEERHTANASMIEELERQAGAWHYARRLRHYVRAAKRVLGERQYVWKLQGTPVDFLDWAANYVEEIDPLGSRPRHPDRTPERSYIYNIADRDLAKLIGRWFNRDEYVPHKLLVPDEDHNEL
jgi:hypothetical protein